MVDNNPTRDRTQEGLNTLFFLAAIGILLIIVYPINAKGPQAYFTALGIGVLGALAAFVSGGFLGFLFGIPKMTNSGTQVTGGQQSNFTHNTNLEQISDWLTKILVGIGLAEFEPIKKEFVKAAQLLADAVARSAVECGVMGCGNLAFGVSVLLSFGILGFLVFYFWTRRYAPGELATAAKEAIEREKRAASVVVEAAARGAVMDRSKGKEVSTKELVSLMAEQAQQEKNIPKELDLTKYEIKSGEFLDDPWKGEFGGKNIANGRRLSAVVDRAPDNKDFFAVKLEVAPHGIRRQEVGRHVRFFLHPTFPTPAPIVPVGPDGTAHISLMAWGAFTVGVLLEDGTKLELDLAGIADAPKEFKER